MFQGGSVFSQTTSAETDKTPKYANEFLNIGVGARAQGMSLAQVASVSDVTSGYWNPAGLTSLKSDLQAAAMHSEYFAGIAKYDYAALAKKIDTISAVSFSVIRFGVDDIPNTIDLIDPGGNVNYDRITTFSAVDYAFILSYGRKGMPWKKAVAERGVAAISALPIEGFRWGINAKVLYRHIGDFAKAWGFGVDAGVQLGVKKWLFGAVAKDITSTFSAWSYSLDDRTREVFQQTGNEIPSNGLEVALPRVVLGAGRGFHLKKISILAEINSTFTTDGKRNTLVSSNPVSIDPGIGVEVGYNNVIFLRLGAGNIQRVKDFDESESLTFQPNLGIGLRIKRLYIDYALSDIGNVSDVLYSNVFSLQLDIYKSAKKL
ncbi:MAG: hypothetical protein IT223_10520 [Crocinitomicaceae bacterium]|nr:hypothetical protein [Crocinitomicaceae bacterium]